MIIIFLLLVESSCETKGLISDPVCNTAVNLELKPELQWRDIPGEVLHLEVYSPSNICNFSFLQPNQHVKNPSCILKDAPLDEDKTLKVEFVNISTWQSTEYNLHFNIQKALFRVPVELTSSVKCDLQVQSQHGLYTVEKLIYRRSQIKPPMAFLTVQYNPHFCSVGNCTPKIMRQASEDLTNILERNGTRLRIEPMLNTPTVNGDQIVTFRVHERLPLPGGDSDASEAEQKLVESLTVTAGIAEKTPALRPSWRVRSVRGSRTCEGDARWPDTASGSTALPREAFDACPGTSAGALVRTCVADARVGARWSPAPPGPAEHATCKENVLHSHLLQEVAQRAKNKRTKGGFQELLDVETILNNITHTQLSEIDVWNVAQILETVDHTVILDSKSIITSTNVVNQLLLLDEDENDPTLRTMQEKAATSTILLKTLDNILWKASLVSSTELIVKEKVAVLVTNTEENDLASFPRGIGIMKEKDEIFKRNKIVQIPNNASLQWMIAQDFSAAVLLPENLIHTLSRESHRLALSAFWDSKLFGGTAYENISGHVIGISIDGQHIELQEPIMLFFEKQSDNSTKNTTSKNICRFWDFEADGRGTWAKAGCILAEYPSSTTDICVCTHLTHFGKLLYNSGSSEMDSEEDSHVLDIVTVVGCSLSLLGLAGVFLSATLLHEGGTGRSIQLQLCGAQAVLMMGLLWDNAALPYSEPKALCCIRGLILHWSVLALGIWTLAAALYQHRRLTQPLQSLALDPKFLPTATALSWGTPAVACCLVIILDNDAYSPPTCYPFGVPLLLSVVVPLGFIVITNSIIFLCIIWSIFHCSSKSIVLRNSQDDTTRTVRRILASAYLFCLLGLCWLFGFLHLQYLFCLTASLQGVSHFVFCVILDRTTRRSWRLYKKKSQTRLSSIKSWTRSSLLPRPKSKEDAKLEALPIKM